MVNVEFNDAEGRSMYELPRQSFPSRFLIEHGFASDQKAANKLLLGIAGIALLAAIFVLAMFYDTVPGKSTVVSPPVFYEQQDY